LIAVVSASVVVHGAGSPSDIFLSTIAAVVVVMVACGGLLVWLGARGRGDVLRFVPVPVVGAFLAGAGWVLFIGGVSVAARVSPFKPLTDLLEGSVLKLWLPALAFGLLLLIATRIVRRPLVLPAGIAIGLVGFVAAVVVTGSSIDEIRAGGWLLGSFDPAVLWKTWTFSALRSANWLSVLESTAAIATAVFVAVLVVLFNISGTESVVDRDLDTNRELRDAGISNLISGALGGIPGSHAPSLTALADRMHVDARVAGSVAALVPLAAAIVGASAIELFPRAIVGGMLVFFGLSFVVEWVWDKRRLLPPLEYGFLLAILVAVVLWGFVLGVVIGLVLAAALFAISYGRVELVREVPFGESYRSNVDRPASERATLRQLGDRVQILRVSGFLFFGSTNRLLERVRHRVEERPPRFLVIDLRRVTGVDASGAATLDRVLTLAGSNGFEVIVTGASAPVRAQLERGGVVEREGFVRFEPDLDRGLQRCEDTLVDAAALANAPAEGPGASAVLDGVPTSLAAHLDRVEVPAGTVLLHQDEPPGDLFFLESGLLAVETVTREGARVRLRRLRPGVVVGEVSLYTDVPRTADVVAETPSVVHRIGRAEIDRLEREEPAVAAALHRWLAAQLSERLTDTMRASDVLLDR
jgi:SulP family sulfate permease